MGHLLAPGFRFHPTDEELVTYYLRRKINDKSFHFDTVSEVDVYKCEPWQLAEFSSLKSRDQEWYFFSAIDKKYENGSRLNRATGVGYWKATGRDRFVRHQNQVIGMKKTLVFHTGRAPTGNRTNWVMHEYRLASEGSKKYGVVAQHPYVLCRVFLKRGFGALNGSRYAPFVDDDWDDNGKVLVAAGEEVEEQTLDGDGMPLGANDFDQGTSPMAKVHVPKTQCHDFAIICNRGKSVTELEPNGFKRSRRDDPSSSNAHKVEIATMAKDEFRLRTTKRSYPTLMGVPLFLEAKESDELVNPATLDASNLDKFVPPGYLKFISKLEDDVMNVSRERESLKVEMLRAQTMINALQSRIGILGRENEDLKAILQRG